ncbi:hypothetical protein B7494_g2444 [Chlorociboria aeruginascens]|nr:hypothetical protein B7494_g2444 [Chlorociboria aeruginascens]
MTIKIYGVAGATCTQRVLATLIEKGVTDWVLEPVNLMAGEQKQPAYLAKQPFGVIPVLEDGDFRVFESRAISYYIAAKYANQGPKLIPDVTDIKETALFHQWYSVEKDNFDHYASPLADQLVFGVMRGNEPDPKLVEFFKSGLAPKLDIFDGILAKQAYMAGNEFSLIDIHYYPYMTKLIQGGNGDMINDRPNIKAWWEKISAREAWKKALAMGSPKK